MSNITSQGVEHWTHLRRRLRRQWWGYLVIGLIGTIFFIHDLPPHEPVGFAVLLLIPIISLRQAWRVDRQIVACNVQLVNIVPSK
jgi:hypothetical protein